MLLRAISSSPVPSHRPNPPADLVEAAAWHGIAGYVHRLLADRTDQDPRARQALDRVCRAVATSHLWALGDLVALQRCFDAEDLPFAVVKGPVVAETLHGDAMLRGYGDLDVLVSPTDLPRAVRILLDDGAQLLDRNWELLAHERRGEIHLRTRRGTVVDLHWHLINDAELRHQLRIDTEELLDRRVFARVGALRVPTTDALDTLLHLALHATISGGDRLVWFKDIEQALIRTADLDLVITRAHDWRAGLLVGSAIDLTRRLTNVAVPASFVATLVSSPSWRTIIAAAAVVSPPARSGGEASPLRMVGRSTRTDVPTSLRELRRRLTAHAMRRQHRTYPRGLYDATNPRSSLWSAGEPVNYLAAVEAEVAESVWGPAN